MCWHVGGTWRVPVVCDGYAVLPRPMLPRHAARVLGPACWRPVSAARGAQAAAAVEGKLDLRDETQAPVHA